MDNSNKLRLEHWYIQNEVAWGIVYNHTKLEDGHRIHTSKIEDVISLGGGDYMIKTLNSEYYVKMSDAVYENFSDKGRDLILSFAKYEWMYKNKQ